MYLELFGMHPKNNPKIDGIPDFFYQNYWSIVNDEICATCLYFLNGDTDTGGINQTVISLISNVNNPKKVTEFRLYNII